MLRHKRLLLVGGLVAVGAVSAGISLAAIPENGVITSCFNTKSGGALRVIDATGTDCKGTETKLEWSQQGPKGDKGDPGEQGEQGIQGPQGPPGLSGRVVITAPFNDDTNSALAFCPAGKVVLGGGHSGPRATYSGPAEGLGAPWQGWVVLGDPPLTAYAICARVG